MIVIAEDRDDGISILQQVKRMGEVSDGYHTFDELYRYRMLLQAAWLNDYYQNYGDVIKSWRHSDGELCFGKEDYFVVVVQLPTGQVSNHYKGEYWDLFNVTDAEYAPEYDGHTPQEAADRIERYVKGEY